MPVFSLDLGSLSLGADIWGFLYRRDSNGKRHQDSRRRCSTYQHHFVSIRQNLETKTK